MGNKATSIDEQIQLLRDRSMELDMSEEKAKEILLDIGYYRLGFYWNPFEIDKSHNFEKGTKFSDVVALYYLDVDLRNILLKYLNRIEINFRTKLVYYASNAYKESPTWFIDPAIVQAKLISNFEKVYNNSFKMNHKIIKHHHTKYINDKYAPAWKTIEFFTFGTTLRIYISLKDRELKEQIAGCFEVDRLHKFINLMETTLYVRNACAHGDVLFDLKTPKGISQLPFYKFSTVNRNSLDASIKVVSYLLSKISGNRNVDLMQHIDELFVKHKENKVLRDIIETKIEYIYP